ncbi:hypothetical protein ZIOFF_036201 [Zingiber officinale]|uniref:GTP cyclohydrolase 1 n=1 Tax=Zingiber officinale TaxID=94328 RepID=A0A8J5L397_ZINOF|nr:hypothetical protein ZIOFF_036201 [Zingiber officinale]
MKTTKGKGFDFFICSLALSLCEWGEEEEATGPLASEAERALSIEEAVKALLQRLGEDHEREGLRRMPHRVAEAFRGGTRDKECSASLCLVKKSSELVLFGFTIRIKNFNSYPRIKSILSTFLSYNLLCYFCYKLLNYECTKRSVRNWWLVLVYGIVQSISSFEPIFSVIGYKQKVKDIVQGALFPEAGLNPGVGHAGGVGGLVVVRDIDLFSYCESCLLPFSIKCHVGYVPSGGRVVGLSKLSRVADVFARRFQDPKRLASEVCAALHNSINLAGVAVSLQCWHMKFSHLCDTNFTHSTISDMQSWGTILASSRSGVFKEGKNSFPRLKEHMEYCINHPEEMSKLSKLKAHITEVKGIMMDNIEKLSLAMTRMYWKKMTSDMGCHIDGFITVVAHTHVIQEGPVTGRAANVIAAANTAAEVALRLVRLGKKKDLVTPDSSSPSSGTCSSGPPPSAKDATCYMSSTQSSPVDQDDKDGFGPEGHVTEPAMETMEDKFLDLIQKQDENRLTVHGPQISSSRCKPFLTSHEEKTSHQATSVVDETRMSTNRKVIVRSSYFKHKPSDVNNGNENNDCIPGGYPVKKRKLSEDNENQPPILVMNQENLPSKNARTSVHHGEDNQVSRLNNNGAMVREGGKFGCDISHVNNYTTIVERSMDRFAALMSSFRYTQSSARASVLRAPLKDVQNSSSSTRRKFTNLKYSRVEIDEVRFEWAKCMLDYI